MLSGTPKAIPFQNRPKHKRPRASKKTRKVKKVEGVSELYKNLKQVSDACETWDTNPCEGWWRSASALEACEAKKLGGQVYKANQVYLPIQSPREESGSPDSTILPEIPTLARERTPRTSAKGIHLSVNKQYPNRSRLLAFHDANVEHITKKSPKARIKNQRHRENEGFVVDDSPRGLLEPVLGQPSSSLHPDLTTPQQDSAPNSRSSHNNTRSIIPPLQLKQLPGLPQTVESKYENILTEHLRQKQKLVLSFEVLLRDRSLLDSQGRLGFVKEREFLLKELALPPPNPLAILLHFKSDPTQERPMMPSLSVNFEQDNWNNRHGYREPVRNRDKDWREYLWSSIAPNLGAPNAEKVPGTFHQRELFAREKALHNVKGILLKEYQILRKGIRVGGHSVVATVSGIGIAGRAFVEGGRFPRLIKVHAYCPFTRRDHDIFITPDRLEALMEDAPELLLPGRKRDLAHALTHMVYFEPDPHQPGAKVLRISSGIKTSEEFLSGGELPSRQGTRGGLTSAESTDPEAVAAELRKRWLVYSRARRIDTHYVVVSIYNFPERKSTYVVRVYHPGTSQQYELPVGARELARLVREPGDSAEWSKATVLRACRQLAKLIHLRSWNNQTAIQVGSRVGLAGPSIVKLEGASPTAPKSREGERRTIQAARPIEEEEEGAVEKLKKTLWKVHVADSGLALQSAKCHQTGWEGAVHAKRSRRFLGIGEALQVNTNVLASGVALVSNTRMIFVWHRCLGSVEEVQQRAQGGLTAGTRAVLQLYEPSRSRLWTLVVEDSDLVEYVKGTALVALVLPQFTSILPPQEPKGGMEEMTATSNDDAPPTEGSEESQLQSEEISEETPLDPDECIESLVRGLLKSRVSLGTSNDDQGFTTQNVHFDRTIFKLSVAIRFEESEEEDPFGDEYLQNSVVDGLSAEGMQYVHQFVENVFATAFQRAGQTKTVDSPAVVCQPTTSLTSPEQEPLSGQDDILSTREHSTKDNADQNTISPRHSNVLDKDGIGSNLKQNGDNLDSASMDNSRENVPETMEDKSESAQLETTKDVNEKTIETKDTSISENVLEGIGDKTKHTTQSGTETAREVNEKHLNAKEPFTGVSPVPETTGDKTETTRVVNGNEGTPKDGEVVNDFTSDETESKTTTSTSAAPADDAKLDSEVIKYKPKVSEVGDENELRKEMCHVEATQEDYGLQFTATLTSLDSRIVTCNLSASLGKELCTSYQALGADERKITIAMFIEEDMRLCHYLNSGRVAFEYSPKEIQESSSEEDSSISGDSSDDSDDITSDSDVEYGTDSSSQGI